MDNFANSDTLFETVMISQCAVPKNKMFFPKKFEYHAVLNQHNGTFEQLHLIDFFVSFFIAKELSSKEQD